MIYHQFPNLHGYYFIVNGLTLYVGDDLVFQQYGQW